MLKYAFIKQSRCRKRCLELIMFFYLTHNYVNQSDVILAKLLSNKKFTLPFLRNLTAIPINFFRSMENPKTPSIKYKE